MAKVEAQENTFLSILLFNVDYRVEMDNGMPIVVRKLTGTRLIASDELFDPTIVRSHWSAYAFTLLLIVGTLISLAVLHRKKRQLTLHSANALPTASPLQLPPARYGHETRKATPGGVAFLVIMRRYTAAF